MSSACARGVSPTDSPSRRGRITARSLSRRRRAMLRCRGRVPMRLLPSVPAAASGLALASLPAAAQQKTTLTVITAGDQNMVDYVKDYLGPIFEKSNPNVTVKSVGTGPGDAGSQKIME